MIFKFKFKKIFSAYIHIYGLIFNVEANDRLLYLACNVLFKNKNIAVFIISCVSNWEKIANLNEFL